MRAIVILGSARAHLPGQGRVGKALKGNRTYLIASGAAPTLPEGFVPFRDASEYFEMRFAESFNRQVR